MSARRPCPPLLVAALAAACGTAPPPPSAPVDVPVPPQFTTPAPTDGSELRDAWWTSFGDRDLDALVAQALEHNHDLRAAAARLGAATAARSSVAGALWPEVDAGFDAQRARRLFLGFPFGSGGVPSSTATTFGLSLAVRWELDVWGRLRAGDAAAVADVEAALADAAGARQSLAAQVCRAWFQAIEAEQQLALARATAATWRATADDVRERYRAGVRPALDVRLAAANLATAEAQAAEREDLALRIRRRLDVLVGGYPSADRSVPAALGADLPTIPAALPSGLLQRRPDLVAAERRLAAAGCRVDAARAALWPRLSLTASGGTASQELADLVDGDFRVFSIGANLLAPLFRGGALRAEVARSEARAEEAAAAYAGAVLRAFAEVEDLLAGDQHLADRQRSLTDAAAHARAAADLARARYQAGLVDFLTVADSQRQAFLAESARLLVERLRRENRVDLFLSLGGGFRRPPPGELP
jgi:NodT family efflux transporter outer membrane factor (OMF) lipoprotein